MGERLTRATQPGAEGIVNGRVDLVVEAAHHLGDHVVELDLGGVPGLEVFVFSASLELLEILAETDHV